MKSPHLFTVGLVGAILCSSPARTAERKARRPDKPIEDKAEAGKAALRIAHPIALAQLPTNEEFALVLTRRNAELQGEPSAEASRQEKEAPEHAHAH